MKLSAYDMYAHSNDASAKNWATMKKDYPNIKVKTFPKPVFDALRAANDKLLDELAKKNPLSKEIIKSRHDYLQKIRAWTNISDKAYLNSFFMVMVTFGILNQIFVIVLKLLLCRLLFID
jgi:TRAP-type mannitol/chloroaromatic compound transport system substrate-binding protein